MQVDEKAPVSPSRPLIGSADVPDEDAERELLEQMSRAYNEMLANSKPDDPEIAKITSDDFWEMYENF